MRLLAGAGQNVLLLERCVPGTPLDPEDLDTAAAVLRALHRPAPPGFRTLAAEAARWRRTIPAKGYERALARNARDPARCVRELATRLELDRERAHGWAFVQALAWDNEAVARALLGG